MKKDNKNSFAETVKKYKLPIICISALVAVLVAIAVINSISTAYLRPYEKKYNIKYPRHIAEEFCDALITENGVATVSGEAFGAGEYVRISYALDEEKIAEGIKRIAEFIRLCK